MLFMDKSKNVLGKSSLVKTIPDERVYSRYLGRLEVISEKEVALITKDEERILQYEKNIHFIGSINWCTADKYYLLFSVLERGISF